eukprot:4627456-Amphidinium_carterae.3
MVAEHTTRTRCTKKNKTQSEGKRHKPSRAKEDTVRGGLRGLFYKWHDDFAVRVQPSRLVIRTDDTWHTQGTGILQYIETKPSRLQFFLRMAKLHNMRFNYATKDYFLSILNRTC